MVAGQLVKQVVGRAHCLDNLPGYDTMVGLVGLVRLVYPRLGKHILLLNHFGKKQLDAAIEQLGRLGQPGEAGKQIIAKPASNQTQLVDQLVSFHVGRQLGCTVVTQQADVVLAAVKHQHFVVFYQVGHGLVLGRAGLADQLAAHAAVVAAVEETETGTTQLAAAGRVVGLPRRLDRQQLLDETAWCQTDWM